MMVRREPRLFAALWSVDGGGRSFLATGLVGLTAGILLALVVVLLTGLVLSPFIFFKAREQGAAATPLPRSRPRLAVLPSLTPTPPPSPAAGIPAHPFFSIEVLELDLTETVEQAPGRTEEVPAAPEPALTAAPLAAWPTAGDISQGFGCSPYYTGRIGPGCPAEAPWFHDGVDIAAAAGAPVRAALGGTVVFAGPDGGGPACRDGYEGYGLAVIIAGEAGWQALYAHLARIAVTVGQVVTPETVIGLAGDTGCTSGAHLHFGLRHNGTLIDPLEAREKG